MQKRKELGLPTGSNVLSELEKENISGGEKTLGQSIIQWIAGLLPKDDKDNN